MAKATCPECDGGIRLERRLRLGQRFLCPHCCAVIEVVSVLPLELDWAYDDDKEGSDGSLEDVWNWAIDKQPVALKGEDSRMATGAGRR